MKATVPPLAEIPDVHDVSQLCSSAHADANVLHLQKLVEAFDAAGAAEPALFVSAVGALGLDVAVPVHPHRTRFQPARNPVCTFQVGGGHEGVETVARIVGDPDGLGLVT